jgi:hypothetical protein
MCRICLGGGDVSLSDSEEIMRAMKKDGKGPDIDVYANHIELIAKLAGRGRACFQDGLAVLQDIKKCGLQPGPKVFNVLMDVVAKDAKNGKVRAEVRTPCQRLRVFLPQRFGVWGLGPPVMVLPWA